MSESLRQGADVRPPLWTERAARLSFSEEFLWLCEHSRIPPVPFIECPHHLSTVTRLENRLDAAALKRALVEVVRRHSVLRSRFSERNGRVFRIVDSRFQVPFRRIDLRTLSRTERERAVEDELRRHVDEPFDLQGGPLLRSTLMRLEDEVHIFGVTVHHIVFDGWSRRVLSKELAALYDAYSQGRASDLDEPQAQYTDYVDWQEARLTDDRLHRLVEAWAARLGPLSGESPDPGDATARSPIIDDRRWNLEAAQAKALREMSRDNGTTPAIGLLALLMLFLHKIDGRSDRIVGLPLSDRRRREFEEMIGLFTNVLIVRTGLEGNPTFLELLQRVRSSLQAAYREQDLPYWHYLRAGGASDAGTRAPYRVVFNFMNRSPQVALELPELTSRNVDVGNRPPGLADLTLQVQDQGDRFACRMWFTAQAAPAELHSALVDRFRSLAALAVEMPTHPLADYMLGG